MTIPFPTANSDEPRPRWLIVRPSALGDVARTVPALVSIRKAVPDAHIDWLVVDLFADVVKDHPDLDGVVTFPRSTFRGLGGQPAFWKWTKCLREGNYDVTIDLQGLFRSGLLSRLTGAKRRVGYANAEELGHVFYTQKTHIDAAKHTVDRMLDLVRFAQCEPVCDLRLYVGEHDSDWLDRYLVERGWGDEPYAVIAPATRWLSKTWPTESYLAIAQRLLDQKPGVDKVVILAAPSEREGIRLITDALRKRREVLIPDTSVGQMMALISRCSLLVCNDSGPLHIGVGFDRPIVAVFGPTDPALVGPYNREDAVVCPHGISDMGPRAYRQDPDDQTLISKVTVDMVWDRALEQLDTQRNRHASAAG